MSLKLINMSIDDRLLKFIENCDWYYIYDIFYTDQVTFEFIQNRLKELESPWGFYFSDSGKYILEHFRDICDDYQSGLSTIDIVQKYDNNFSRTNLQTYLKKYINLRNQSEAALKAVEKGYIHGGFCNSRYKYKLGDKVFNLKSSWELCFIQYLLDQDDIVDINYENIYIPYKDSDGLDRVYIPDFQVTYKSGDVVIYEIKPTHRLTEDNTIIKANAAIAYCKCNKFSYKFITESDLDFDNYPKFPDSNIIDQSLYDYSGKTHDEIVQLRKLQDYEYINIEYDEHFVSKIISGEYNYKMHPKSNLDFTYNSIMEFINSFGLYECTHKDLFNYITRNCLIRRLRDEAPEKEKDIWYFECKYLKKESLPMIPKYLSAMWELQCSKVRDFGMPGKYTLLKYLLSLNKIVSYTDFYPFFMDKFGKGYRFVNSYFQVTKIDGQSLIDLVNIKKFNYNWRNQ